QDPPSDLLSQLLDLLVGEYRAVHAHIGHSNAAVAALAHAALHISLQGGNNVLFRAAHGQQVTDYEAEHYRRPAYEGHAVVHRHLHPRPREQAAHHAHVAIPVLIGTVH